MAEADTEYYRRVDSAAMEAQVASTIVEVTISVEGEPFRVVVFSICEVGSGDLSPAEVAQRLYQSSIEDWLRRIIPYLPPAVKYVGTHPGLLRYVGLELSPRAAAEIMGPLPSGTEASKPKGTRDPDKYLKEQRDKLFRDMG